jgi:hypothetical protein
MLEISAMTIDDYDEAMSLWRQTPELGVFRRMAAPQRHWRRHARTKHCRPA